MVTTSHDRYMVHRCTKSKMLCKSAEEAHIWLKEHFMHLVCITGYITTHLMFHEAMLYVICVCIQSYHIILTLWYKHIHMLL